MTFKHLTPAQFAAKLRQEFKNASSYRACQIIRWVFANYTDAQIKNYFNLTTVQLTNFKAKWQPIVAGWLASRDAAGE